MKKIAAIIINLILINQLNAQLAMGEWRLHVSPSKTVEVAAGNGVVMAAYPDGILEYDINKEEKTLWTKVNALSDVDISTIAFDKQSSSFWIGYKNGNIDRISKENKVTNIPWLRLAQIQGDKNINSFHFQNDICYVATNLGILQIKSNTNDVLDTYYTNNAGLGTLQVLISNDTIFALSKDRLFYANINNVALTSYTQWQTDTRIPIQTTNQYQNIIKVNNTKFLSFHNPNYGMDSVYRIQQNEIKMVVGDIFDMEILKIKNEDGKLMVILNSGVLVYDEELNFDISFNKYSFSETFASNSALIYQDRYWIADANHGLVFYQNHLLNYPVNIPGPPKNSYFSVKGSNGQVGIAGGTVERSEIYFNNSGLYVYADEDWKLYDVWNQNEWKNKVIFDISCMAFSSRDPQKIAIGSHSRVPLSIAKDGQVTHTFDQHNSGLDSNYLGNSYTMVTDLAYDTQDNLWILNGMSDSPLKVYKSDGSFDTFFTGTDVRNRFTKGLSIDYNGNKWFSVDGVGLVGFSDNGTVNDKSDDSYRILRNVLNQGNLPSQNVNAIAVDFDNEIWIGTDEGFAVLYNSSGIFSSSTTNYNAQRIIIGFEEANEYMLGSTSISAIQIDGGNRKWFGTANAGIFLLSPDGTELIANYTSENSGLISNNILDMDFNHKTGELFIITDKGLVSLRTGSSYEDPEYSDVQVFPNPAPAGYNGLITMQGIKYDSDVRVTDIAGNLIYKTTSVGGTATWNGKTMSGDKVKSGVYLIWTASNTQKGRKVGQVTIIE